LKRKIEWVLLGVVVLLAVAIYAAPAARFLIWVTGNGKGCGLRACLEEVEPRILAEGARVMRASAVVERDAEGFELHRTPAGLFWSPKGNILYYNLGEMAVEAYGSGGEGVKPGDVVLDCGANVGTFTREALRAGASKVVTLEIDPRNIECLRRNFWEEIGQGKVVVVAKGVWSDERLVEVKIYGNSNWNTAAMPERPETREQPQVVKLPVTSIDRVVEELGLERVDFLKMDVEGAEVEALRGARKTLQRWRPRLSVATENLPDDIDRVPETVKGMVPEYRFQAGPCRKVRKFMIRPEVVHGWVE
jgi:FkbM family methyltransferase